MGGTNLRIPTRIFNGLFSIVLVLTMTKSGHPESLVLNEGA